MPPSEKWLSRFDWSLVHGGLCWNLCFGTVSGWMRNIGLGSEVNLLIIEVLVEGFPAVDLSRGDLTRGE